MLKQFIQGKCEFIIVLSRFDSLDWQSKSLIVEREIRKIKKSTSAAIISFSFDEIVNSSSSEELKGLFISRFQDYLYENNMLGDTVAIDDDNLLFGDRGKIADLIVSRCQKNAHSGIFGLRRSGKTSVLKASLRRLENLE